MAAVVRGRYARCARYLAGWCTGSMAEPLIFRPGDAATAFNVAVAVWVVFELVMNVRQRWRAGGPAARDPTAIVLSACIVAAVITAEQLRPQSRVPRAGGPGLAGPARPVPIAAGDGPRAPAHV